MSSKLVTSLVTISRVDFTVTKQLFLLISYISLLNWLQAVNCVTISSETKSIPPSTLSENGKNAPILQNFLRDLNETSCSSLTCFSLTHTLDLRNLEFLPCDRDVSNDQCLPSQTGLMCDQLGLGYERFCYCPLGFALNVTRGMGKCQMAEPCYQQAGSTIESLKSNNTTVERDLKVNSCINGMVCQKHDCSCSNDMSNALFDSRSRSCVVSYHTQIFKIEQHPLYGIHYNPENSGGKGGAVELALNVTTVALIISLVVVIFLFFVYYSTRVGSPEFVFESGDKGKKTRVLPFVFSVENGGQFKKVNGRLSKMKNLELVNYFSDLFKHDSYKCREPPPSEINEGMDVPDEVKNGSNMLHHHHSNNQLAAWNVPSLDYLDEEETLKYINKHHHQNNNNTRGTNIDDSASPNVLSSVNSDQINNNDNIKYIPKNTHSIRTNNERSAFSEYNSQKSSANLKVSESRDKKELTTLNNEGYEHETH